MMTDLIGTADIARMLGLCREHVTSRVTKRPDFPAPALVLSRKTVRWDRAAVVRWLEQQRIKAARRSAPGSRGSTSSAG